MSIYIAGIGGTLMAGIARLASERGDKVGGCDAQLYAPMDEQLAKLGVAVDIIDGAGDAPSAACDFGRDAERVVIGNALSRGHPLVERVLRERQPFCSAPQWLRDEVLRERDVAAVAGTHGKTTTTSMLAWILSARRDAGFLVGGVPVDTGVSARLGEGAFVLEADEYDTAFFDKRPKFLHYFPRVLVLNNLDYDHADIFADLAAIQTQFAYLLRTVSDDGKVIWNGDDDNLRDVMARGCWTSAESFGASERADWRLLPIDERGAARREGAQEQASWTFDFAYGGETMQCDLQLFGKHNALNALAAIAAAAQFGIAPREAAEALASFRGVRRRLEVRARGENATVYDDFAHHPQAIRASLDGVRQYAGDARVVAVFEPRSNTMKLGCHNAQLADAFARADRVLCYTPPDWAGEAAFDAHADATVCADEGALWRALKEDLDAADRGETHYVVMSNGRFFGLVDRLADAVRATAGDAKA